MQVGGVRHGQAAVEVVCPHCGHSSYLVASATSG
jgi:hypothetical protein